MTDAQLIAKLINCKGIKISDFSLNDIGSILDIWVHPYKNGGCCPTCGRRCQLISSLPELACAVRLILCNICPHTRSERVSFHSQHIMRWVG